MSATFTELERLMGERLGLAGALAPETELVADLALDSIQQIDLLIELENHFAICLDPEEEQEVRTIGDLVAWIDRVRAEEAAHA